MLGHLFNPGGGGGGWIYGSVREEGMKEGKKGGRVEGWKGGKLTGGWYLLQQYWLPS